MQMNVILMEIANHPVVKAAAVRLAVELAEGGLAKTIDRAIDRMAYSIAKKIIEENKQKGKQL